MIDYGLVDQSIEFYSGRGYDRVEVPWLVSKAVSDMTKPEGCSTYTVTKETKRAEKVFVASAEQSFLYQVCKGHLPESGKFQAVSPCMRDETFDETHTKYFVKNELITFWQPGQVDQKFRDDMVWSTVDDAMSFFKRVIRERDGDPDALEALVTGEASVDVTYRGVELGSYGFRRCSFCEWVYGTGLAEPRFSRFVQKVRRRG